VTSRASALGRLPAALALAAAAVSGCGNLVDARAPSPPAAAATRPATKSTCPDIAWQPPPSLALEQSARELVPFGPTLLGVEATWTGVGFTVQTVAGGYVDDLTEAYDNLRTTGTIPLRADPAAEIMHGTLRGSPVALVLWRDTSQPVPCDVHVFLVQGADPATEALLITGLR
jgi:hypothetical protein